MFSFPIAGWSSQVARQAHNLKVAGSNPAPATNFDNPGRLMATWVVFCLQKPVEQAVSGQVQCVSRQRFYFRKAPFAQPKANPAPRNRFLKPFLSLNGSKDSFMNCGGCALCNCLKSKLAGRRRRFPWGQDAAGRACRQTSPLRRVGAASGWPVPAPQASCAAACTDR
jgi:hypothetical protein